MNTGFIQIENEPYFLATGKGRNKVPILTKRASKTLHFVFTDAQFNYSDDHKFQLKIKNQWLLLNLEE